MGTTFYTAILENRIVQEAPDGRLYVTSLASAPIDVTIVTPDFFGDVTKTLNPGETFLYLVEHGYHLYESEFSFKGKYH